MVDSRPVLKGRQERLGQSGQLTLRCDNGPVIEFMNDRKKYTLKNAPTSSFELLLDKQKSDISKQIDSRVKPNVMNSLLCSFALRPIKSSKYLAQTYLA